MVSMEAVLVMFAVALLWGITTPLMRLGKILSPLRFQWSGSTVNILAKMAYLCHGKEIRPKLFEELIFARFSGF